MLTRTDASDSYVPWRTVFHVTHEKSLPSIRRWGLDPNHSRRPARRIWLCDLSLLPWAMRHVCAKQGWQYGEIKVLRVCLPGDVLIRHRAGVYYVNFRIPPQNLGATLSCQY